MEQVHEDVPFEDIIADDQARRVGETEGALESLKESIKTVGLLDSPIVEDVGDGKRRLCTGRSRYKCIKSLRTENPNLFRTVPCTVLRFDAHELLDETYKNYKVSQVIFDSNDKRTALTKLEQARHYKSQMDRFPHMLPDYMAVAKVNNKEVSEVKEVMDLLAIDPAVMERIENLNIERAGTVPAMCIQEIAAAAALDKKPLPKDGQMEVVERLVAPDLGDRRALVLRNHMQALIKAVRREYIPETRGRKPISVPEPVQTEVSDVAGNNKSLSATDLFGSPSNSEDKAAQQSEISDTHGVSAFDVADAQTSKSEKSDAVSLTARSTETPYNALPIDLESTASGSNNGVVPFISLALVEGSLNNVYTILSRAHLHITEEQYERTAVRLENIRSILEKSIIQPAEAQVKG